MRGLRHLPAILSFQQLLLGRYNRRISIEMARKKTVGEVLTEVGHNSEWMQAWRGFQDGWNQCWKSMVKFGCLEIPEVYRSQGMTEATPLSFCLINDANEGILPLAVTQFLGQKHNEICELVRELEVMKTGSEAHTLEQEVSSRFFNESHALNYSMDQLVHFIQRHCVSYSSAGQPRYNFARAEWMLVDSFFGDKPHIKVGLRYTRVVFLSARFCFY